MIDPKTLRRTGLVLALGLAATACAQRQSPPPAQQSGGMSGMGMQGHDMSEMNMQQMMAPGFTHEIAMVDQPTSMNAL